jgi:hypothetical protein
VLSSRFRQLRRPEIGDLDRDRWPDHLRLVEEGRGGVLPYDLSMPKWQFLSLLVESAG